MSIVLKIGILYPEYMILVEVLRENFGRIQSRIRISIALDIGILYQEHDSRGGGPRKFYGVIQSRIRMSIVLIFGTLYEEHMVLEEVAQEHFRREAIEN